MHSRRSGLNQKCNGWPPPSRAIQVQADFLNAKNAAVRPPTLRSSRSIHSADQLAVSVLSAAPAAVLVDVDVIRGFGERGECGLAVAGARNEHADVGQSSPCLCPAATCIQLDVVRA